MDYAKATVFPAIVNINVMRGRCPCRCVHCPVGVVPPETRAKHFGDQQMTFDLFAKIAEEVGQNSSSLLRLHSVGEPLLWKNIRRALRFLQARNVNAWIFTCAVTKDEQLLAMLCESLSIIEVSVNASDRMDFQRTKGIDAFETVCRNIDFMADFIRKNGLKTRLLLSRVQSSDQAADEAFLACWRERSVADDVFVRSWHNYNNLLEPRGDGMEKMPCLVHWARASIDWDGAMVCCFNEMFHDYSEDVVLGRLDENTGISEIWRGKKLAEIRKHDQTGDFSGMDFDIPCKHCTSCQPVETKRETSEKQLQLIRNES